MIRFKKMGKISPHYIGHCKRFRMFRKVDYELDFPASLASFHLMFHVSMNKKCVDDHYRVIPVENISVKDSLSYE